MNGKKILLVEDEELIGTMVRLNLMREGYEVTWTRVGLPAPEIAGRESFDLILLDIMLPDADGIELARKMRKDGIAAPILMLTAKGDVVTKVGALDSGADDFLTKPFDIRELSARVRALVRRGRADS